MSALRITKRGICWTGMVPKMDSGSNGGRLTANVIQVPVPVMVKKGTASLAPKNRLIVEPDTLVGSGLSRPRTASAEGQRF